MELRLADLRRGLAPLLLFTALYVAYFSPVLFGGRILAPGDGLLQYYPAFAGGQSLWNPDLFSGYPSYADPQSAHWYPLRALFGVLGSFNGFVVSAYVLASFFSYLLVRRLTESPIAGVCGGLVYGMGGFYVSHLGHTPIVHAAAWLPLHLLALHELSLRPSWRWFSLAAAAVCCGILAGHPQAFVYSLLLAGAFALFSSAGAAGGRLRYLSIAAGSLVAGLGLAAIALFPMAELSALSVRAELPFSEFVTYSIPKRQLAAIFFPTLFGGMPPSIYKLPYIGAWNLGEVTPWVGIAPLLLAAFSFLAPERRRPAFFWWIAAIVAIVFALGPLTPVSSLLYRIPILDKFRAQGRHVLEFSMAIAVLAGYGVAALQKLPIARRLVAVGPGAIGMLVAMGAVLANLSANGTVARMAASVGASISFSPLRNPSVGLPFLLFSITALALAIWAARPGRLSAALFAAALIAELGQYGWFFEWRFGSPTRLETVRPASLDRYAAELATSHQRVFPLKGTEQWDGPIPNLSSLWSLPSASGYNPLLLDSYRRLLDIEYYGALDPGRLVPGNVSLDLLAVRYLFAPTSARLSLSDSPRMDVDPLGSSDSMKWSPDSLRIELGPGCDPAHPLLASLTTGGLPVDQIGVVSSLGCSGTVPDGAAVVRLEAFFADGATKTFFVRAGEDTAEWSWERPDVRRTIRHRMARVFSSSPEVDQAGTFDGHSYLALFSTGRVEPVVRIELEWVGPSASILVDKLSLRNSATGAVFAARRPTATSPGQWKLAGTAGSSAIWENLHAMPRVWLASEAVGLGDEEAVRAIVTSRLPGGRAFEPALTALVHEELAAPIGPPAPGAGAVVVGLERDAMEVETRSSSPALLITSDVWYLGWTATVDGQAAPVIRADYLLRGVRVPQGTHRVRFAFRPRRLLLGAAISAAAVLGLALAGAHSRRRGRPPTP